MSWVRRKKSRVARFVGAAIVLAFLAFEAWWVAPSSDAVSGATSERGEAARQRLVTAALDPTELNDDTFRQARPRPVTVMRGLGPARPPFSSARSVRRVRVAPRVRALDVWRCRERGAPQDDELPPLSGFPA